MKGIELAEVRQAIVNSFGAQPYTFDILLHERFDFQRVHHVADGPFMKVVGEVLAIAQEEGWEALLVAEVAAARPLRKDVQALYARFAAGLIDETRQIRVEEKRRQALERFGLTAQVDLQRAGRPDLAAPAAAAASGLQSTVKQRLPMLDFEVWLQRQVRVQGQVCRVEVEGRPRGTGFLVGPDVVLTNYHVLEPVLRERVPAASAGFRFDYRVLANGSRSNGEVVPLHLTDWRIDESPSTAGETTGHPEQSVPGPDELDYALVRLSRPFGGEPLQATLSGSPSRGWVVVPSTAPPFVPGMPLLIAQHPNAEPLKLAFDTESVIGVVGEGRRVRYATNTLPGSSGSPCFDLDWSLVALHHYGDPGYNHAPSYNQGVPIHVIHERLKQRGKAAVLAAPSQ